MTDSTLRPDPSPSRASLSGLASRAATLAALAVLAACGSEHPGYPTSTPPPPPSVQTVNATPALAFTPPELIVSEGDSVNFAFGSLRHNVYFDAAAFAPDDIRGDNVDTSVSRVFTTAGTYHYTCHIHPSMNGVVIVTPRAR